MSECQNCGCPYSASVTSAERAERAEADVSRLREALLLLVDDTARLTHNPEACSRLTECDEAAETGEECAIGEGPECPECSCGAKRTRRLAAAARLVLRETGGEL